MARTKLKQVVQCLRQASRGKERSGESDRALLERFVQGRDEEAFAALVRRHGPLVLSACRQVLDAATDLDDAFQATFLVLLKKARSVDWRASLGSWLYAVAHRVAVRVRSEARRRRDRETEAGKRRPVEASPADLSWQEACTVLHEELDHLPEQYRLPLLLCYLQGQSRDEAAGNLGSTVGAIRGCLQRGRTMLAGRLARRGIALSAGLLAVVAGESRAAGGPRPELVDMTVRAAAGTVSPGVAALVQGASRMTLFGNKLLVPALLLAGLLGAGLMFCQPDGTARAREELPGRASLAGSQKQGPVDAKETAKPPADDRDTVAYAGRVLGPDGKPVAGAKLYLTGGGHEAPECATTGADGRFQFTVPKAKFGDHYTVVTAAAANHGTGWIQIRDGGKRDELTLQLVKDDVPITGQIVDLEGKPVKGATLTVLKINAAPGEDLTPWFEAARARKGLSFQLQQRYLPRYTTGLSPKATTDAEGRFRLSGIGRDRLVQVRLAGPTIATQHLYVLTRPGKTIEVTYHKGDREYADPSVVTTYYGADFRHAAAPCQPIVGVIRDADTKKPLAGVTVRSYALAVGPSAFRSLDTGDRATTDAEGRYRLMGMPKGKGYSIAAVPGKDQPYIARHVDVPEGIGLNPVTADIELKRGVWIEGKLTDKVTGKPLKGSVEYFSMYDNPNLRDYPGYEGTILMSDLWASAKEDGSFRIVGLPGPGLIGVYYQRPPYLRADHRDDEFGTKEKSLKTAPYWLGFTSNYNAIARVDPAKGVESVKQDVTLDPGWTFKGTVLGPDDKPLAGARSCDMNGRRRWEPEGMKTAEFTAGFNPRRPYDVLFQHLEKGLVGVAKPPKENGGSVTVRMEAGATVSGRLVDADGKPRAGVELEVSFRPKGFGNWHDYSPERIQTDRGGRFRVEALLPGHEFRLSDDRGELLLGGEFRSGQVKDLGEVRMTKEEKEEE